MRSSYFKEGKLGSVVVFAIVVGSFIDSCLVSLSSSVVVSFIVVVFVDVSVVVFVVDIFVVSVVVIVDKGPFRPELLILDIVGSWVVNTVETWVVGPCRILRDLVGPCGALWGLVGPFGTLWGLVGQQQRFHSACQTPVAYTASISSHQVSNSSLRKCQQMKYKVSSKHKQPQPNFQ